MSGYIIFEIMNADCLKSSQNIWKAIGVVDCESFLVFLTGRRVKRKEKRQRRNQFLKMPLLMQSYGKQNWMPWRNLDKNTGKLYQ